MKHINVPAQVTTVEDKIAGNLTLAQLSLIAASIFIDFTIYAVFPKSLHLNIYKIPMMLCLTSLLCVAAVRTRGRIIFAWFVILARYERRSRLHVFDKNSEYLRTTEDTSTKDVNKHRQELNPQRKLITPVVEVGDKLEHFKFIFKQEKKGRLHVYVTEK